MVYTTDIIETYVCRSMMNNFNFSQESAVGLFRLIILMKNFARAVPNEITESGKIDGAGDFTETILKQSCRQRQHRHN